MDVDETFESAVLPQIPKTVSPGISAEQEASATEAVAGFVKAFRQAGQIPPFSKQFCYSLKTSIEKRPDKHNYFCTSLSARVEVLENCQDVSSNIVKSPFKRHEV